jgi:DNA-binding transcriptional LysR family regulator
VDLRISLYKLSVFCRVVELGSMTRAAESLGVAQPVVTGHIRSLERRLDTKLFARSGRGVELTETGHIAHRWARDVVGRTREVEAVFDALTDRVDNTVTIVSSPAPATYVLPNILMRFREDHPDAVVRLKLLPTELGTRAVADGECDFAVLAHSVGDEASAGLEAVPLRHEDEVLVAAPDYPDAGDEVTLEQLAELPFICTPEGTPRRRLLDGRLREAGATDRAIVIEFGHTEPIKEAVARGLGVAFLSRSSVAPELESGALREIVVQDLALSFPLEILFRPERRFTQLQSALLDAVRDALR